MVNDSVPVVNRDYHLDKERDEGMDGVKMVYFSLTFALVLQIYSP